MISSVVEKNLSDWKFLGHFVHSVSIIPEGHKDIDDPSVNNRITQELTYKKKYELAKNKFSNLLNQYKVYVDEEFNNLTEEQLGDFDPLDQWLNENTTGILNAAHGRRALQSNTTGCNNTAVGTYAMCGNTSGKNNTASGKYSLFK